MVSPLTKVNTNTLNGLSNDYNAILNEGMIQYETLL